MALRALTWPPMTRDIGAQERVKRKLGGVTHGTCAIRVDDEHIPRRDARLSEVEGSPKLLHVVDIER